MVNIYILLFRNKPFYVGKTKQIPQTKARHRKRFKNDGCIFEYIGYEYNNEDLGKVIKEFFSNFELEVIDVVTNSEWKFWESYWISQFKTWGFGLINKNKGGGGPSKYSEEWKKRQSNIIKNHPIRGKKISESLSLVNHSQYYTKEVRDKMSKNLKGRNKTFSKTHLINLAEANLKSKGKIVECYNLEGNFVDEFKCLREAKEWLLKKFPNISKNVDKQIKDCCNNRQKKCHNYIWRYKN